VIPSGSVASFDETMMGSALALASKIVGTTSPNPWVGAILVDSDGEAFEGATEPPPGRHAEIVALDALKQAGKSSEGATLYVTLEPCSHYGRTPPCVNSIIDAGIKRVVIAMQDPDPKVNGSGIKALEDANIDVEVGTLTAEVQELLMPYIKHRVLGMPWVTLKLAVSVDGRIAASDGSSKWITGEVARKDVHLMRSRSDVIIVGAGTVRSDDPQLTVRLGTRVSAPLETQEESEMSETPETPEIGYAGYTKGTTNTGDTRGGRFPSGSDYEVVGLHSDDHPEKSESDDRKIHQPLRIVLGRIPQGARVLPAREYDGDITDLLKGLAEEGYMSVLVEGGSAVAHEFHNAGMIDRYILYMAPVLFGGDDARPMFSGPGVQSMHELWRGQFVEITPMGDDIKVSIEPKERTWWH